MQAHQARSPAAGDDGEGRDGDVGCDGGAARRAREGAALGAHGRASACVGAQHALEVSSALGILSPAPSPARRLARVPSSLAPSALP